MKRLFCAIDLPERILDEITATYQAIHGARWMAENELHCTLRFYGATAPDREQSLVSALRSINATPFLLRCKGVGYFPPRKDPTVLWIGLADDNGMLARLQSSIERTSVAAGFSPEPRKFTPHITVARLNGVSPDRVAGYILANSLFTTAPFESTGFHLYASHLGKSGATYTREYTFSTVRGI